MNALLLSLLSTLFSAAMLTAQEPREIVSPELQADRTVVLRLWAPRASEVQLSGDWMGPQPPVALSKSEDGVWSVRVGPLPPNIYTYGFLIDGVRTSDPACRCTLSWAGRAASSSFVVPGESPRIWENHNHPAGTLHHEKFFSKRQQQMRRFVVYTPPGYQSAGSEQYPALVLLPGVPGDESDWTSGGGFAEVMFDNLIAQHKMTPMLVVMHASDVGESPRKRSDENLQGFEAIFLDELLPVVRQRYRVSSDPRRWAIAGLSLGGEFAMYVGLKHPELFGAIASLSGSLVPNSLDTRFGRALADSKTVAANRLIWIGCGSEDVFFGGAKAFAERLKTNKVRHVFREFAGPHIMPVFRQELAEMLPLLFRDQPQSNSR